MVLVCLNVDLFLGERTRRERLRQQVIAAVDPDDRGLVVLVDESDDLQAEPAAPGVAVDLSDTTSARSPRPYHPWAAKPPWGGLHDFGGLRGGELAAYRHEFDVELVLTRKGVGRGEERLAALVTEQHRAA